MIWKSCHKRSCCISPKPLMTDRFFTTHESMRMKFHKGRPVTDVLLATSSQLCLDLTTKHQLYTYFLIVKLFILIPFSTFVLSHWIHELSVLFLFSQLRLPQMGSQALYHQGINYQAYLILPV